MGLTTKQKDIIKLVGSEEAVKVDVINKRVLQKCIEKGLLEIYEDSVVLTQQGIQSLEGFRNSPETDFLNDLLKTFDKPRSNFLIIFCNCKSQINMDLEVTLRIGEQEYYIRCEAKVGSQNDSTHYADKNNAVHKVFGEILKGRHLKYAAEPNDKAEVVYGLAIPKRDEEFFKKNYGKLRGDWNLYGKTFDCKFVLVFDEKLKILECYNWNDGWLNGKSPVVTIR